jgi:Tfp pilus assembly protein PilN
MENKFIAINLNQTVNRFQLEEMKLERTRWIIFGAISFIMVGLSVWFLILNSSSNSLISSREAIIDEIKTEINELKKEGQINLAKKNIESLYKLENERVFWVNKLQTLADITPINMAITELEFSKKKFSISAVTRLGDDSKEFDVIEYFIELLKENEYFSKDFTSIKFSSSERINSRGNEIFTFKVDCLLKSKSKRAKKKRRK